MNSSSVSVALGVEPVLAQDVVVLRRGRFAAVISALVITIGWTLAGGHALVWDAVNYHFYLGFAALNDRFAVDFFAAGTPSYINPYAYIPLYLLARSEAPAVLIAALLATCHAAMLWLTYEMALLSCAGKAAQRVAVGMLAVLLAVLSPVFIGCVGLTHSDIPVGIVTLAGWLAMARAVRSPDDRLVITSGVLCGVAAALKLSNALYAIAALTMVVLLPVSPRKRLIASAMFGIACGTAFVVVSLPWSWKLWETFGNPFFPFLNHWFASPDFTSEALQYERFRPQGWLQMLMRPFDMLSPRDLQHTELHAPDARFAALFLLLAAWLLLRSRVARTAVTPADGDANGAAAQRSFHALILGFLVAWGLWLFASGNSRYFLPMSSITAVLIAAILQRLYHRWKDATLTVGALLLLVQVTQLVIAADWKRDGSQWAGPMLKAEFPDRYRQEPYLFLSTSYKSGSAFLANWHSQSGMITTSGFYALGPGHPGWERMSAMLERNSNRVRILRLLPTGAKSLNDLPGPPSDLDVDVRRFGLRVDGGDCDIVRLLAYPVDIIHPRRPEDNWLSFLTCRLVAAPANAEAYQREVRPIDTVFNRVEDTCPNLFHPRRPVTEQVPRWMRRYNMGSEMQLQISEGRVIYRSALLGGDPIDAGAVDAWLRESQPIDCSRKFAPPFGGVAEPPAVKP
ncbi:MAG TPA: hypothetical protein VNG69_05160 [Casimicrobiaceae bacterium]|nr:hypothetical protein [Casimicrobiaceae bacterium]